MSNFKAIVLAPVSICSMRGEAMSFCKDIFEAKETYQNAPFRWTLFKSGVENVGGVTTLDATDIQTEIYNRA